MTASMQKHAKRLCAALIAIALAACTITPPPKSVESRPPAAVEQRDARSVQGARRAAHLRAQSVARAEGHAAGDAALVRRGLVHRRSQRARGRIVRVPHQRRRRSRSHRARVAAPRVAVARTARAACSTAAAGSNSSKAGCSTTTASSSCRRRTRRKRRPSIRPFRPGCRRATHDRYNFRHPQPAPSGTACRALIRPLRARASGRTPRGSARSEPRHHVHAVRQARCHSYKASRDTRAEHPATTTTETPCPQHRFPPHAPNDGKNSSFARDFRELHRHRHRVLRFLRLRHRRRARDRPGVLPARLARGAGAVGVRHVRHRVHRAADRLVHLRPFRRPHRPQIDARRVAARDGRLDDADRLRPRLRFDRQPGARAALHPALRARHRSRRRMGRRGAPRDRIRAARQARLVRHVPATRAVDRFPGVERPVLRPRALALRRTVPQLGLARAVSS